MTSLPDIAALGGRSLVAHLFQGAALPVDAYNDNTINILGEGSFGRPLVNGYKATGEGEDYRVVSWTDPNQPAQHHVGFLFERWPAGSLTRMDKAPKTDLWIYRTLPSRAEADAMGQSLTLNHTFGMITQDLLPACTKYERLPGQYLPFRKPPHWNIKPERPPVATVL